MAEHDLPDWTTEMDGEILEMMTIGWTLTPAVIADNIGRSREAVARRLNALEAGELVEKLDRGKYKITEKGDNIVDSDWEAMEISKKKQHDLAEEEHHRQLRIEEDLGISEQEYLQEVSEEYDHLKSRNPDASDNLLGEAFDIVEERYKE